ncbi:MAG TPA: LuxR family transcriptional regulator, partial [bacterium]|nr:LuxR family transcriptional regulator [bacterium]
MQILNAKLYIPPPRPNLVARPKLIAQLDEGLRLGCKLSLVCAPAGFGKTTLVSAWVHDLRQRVPVAWLSIDEEDNDSQRFAVYVVAALRTLLSASDAENFGAHFLTEIHTPHHISGDVMAQVREQVAILLNDIAALPEKFVLVLDDYYLLNDPRIEQGMVFLLAHQPPQMHLVITSRTTPSLPLARLRARAQLTELNADNLRFTPDEANLFFDQTMGLALSSEHITQLEMRTEGWAAGLQMAALSMQGVADKASFIQTFAGDDHYILDYLLEEVLRRQPEAVQDFMLRTSVLERMCGPLCDAILGMGARELGSKGDISSPLPPVPVSQTTLEYLERANLFIVPLDNKHQWYRYHHLFGELLRHRLEQKMGEAAVMALHQA